MIFKLINCPDSIQYQLSYRYRNWLVNNVQCKRYGHHKNNLDSDDKSHMEELKNTTFMQINDINLKN